MNSGRPIDKISISGLGYAPGIEETRKETLKDIDAGVPDEGLMSASPRS